MIEKLQSAIDRTLTLPGVLQWRKRRFDRAFEAGNLSGACRGVFASYAEALAAAPSTLPLGYNNADAAQMYRDRLDRIFPGDYPMLLWLSKAFGGGATCVFDLGGHVGIGYYAYRKYIEYPHNLTWHVCDVPAVVTAGRELAAVRDSAGCLTFSDRFEHCNTADILFTSGCVQYLENTLAEKLLSLQQRPAWILINVLPLHKEFACWTVQSIGPAFCPYHIQQEESFFSDLKQLGYRILDRWDNLERQCEIAFASEYHLNRYAGAALRLG